MSDPTERHKLDPHPISSHRTPEEIAEDEAGPIGDATWHYAKPAPDDGGEREKEKRPAPRQEPKAK